jgi:hypothetical protein
MGKGRRWESGNTDAQQLRASSFSASQFKIGNISFTSMVLIFEKSLILTR